ncbi:MAG: AMP-binding protein [Desulfonatronovibrionaceae bacterium]
MSEQSETLLEVLNASCSRYADKPALSFVGQEPLSYARLADDVERLGAFLSENGISSGDRVALLGENMPNWGVAFLGIVCIGAVAVPILPDFHTGAIAHILRHCGAKAIFVSKQLYPKLEEAELEGLQVIFIDDFSVLPARTVRGKFTGALNLGRKELGRVRETARRWTGRGQNNPDGDDLAAVIYTSGTTGHSKGVMLTHKNFVFEARAAAGIVGATHEERFLSILPLAHAYECSLGLLTPIMLGAAVYYLQGRPTPRILLPAMAEVKPTVILSVPLVIEKIFKGKILPQLNKNKMARAAYRVPFLRKKAHRMAGKKLLHSFGGCLRVFCIGGAGIARDTELFLYEAGFPYSVGYGLTETAPLVAGASPEKMKFRSTGPALPGVQIKIKDPDPKMGVGEVLVKGPNVMRGYFKAPQITEDSFDQGWFLTGDLGRLDQEGYLFIKGRSKNVILGSSGENIYPEEIESTINEYDYVYESLVYKQNGQLTARVYLNSEYVDREMGLGELSETEYRDRIRELLEELRANVNQRVPGFARLARIIEQTEPFEKTPTQKIKRYLYVDSNGICA